MTAWLIAHPGPDLGITWPKPRRDEQLGAYMTRTSLSEIPPFYYAGLRQLMERREAEVREGRLSIASHE